MTDMPPAWLGVIFDVIWPLVFLGLAAIAFFRFRATAAGWCLGGSFLALAMRSIVLNVLGSTLMAGLAYNETPWTAFWLVSAVIAGICYTGIAVGVFLIPRSLERLSRR